MEQENDYGVHKKNSFRKTSAAIAVTCLVTVIVLGIAIYALRQTSQVFSRLVPQAEAMLVGIKDIYSLGLQQGQAIRNIILDPGNSVAYTNLDKAIKDFNKTCSQLSEITESAGEKVFSAKVREIAVLEQEDQKIIQEIKDIVKGGQKDQALEILNKKETPLWRKNKAVILTLNEEMEAYRKRTYAQTDAKAHTYMTALILVTFVPILVCLGLGFLLTSVLRQIKGIGRGLWKGADQVASASSQVSSASQSLAEGASEQAAGLEETSSSLEEMASMTKQNADNAGQANILMRDTGRVMDEAE